jgi:hypothetical protein
VVVAGGTGLSRPDTPGNRAADPPPGSRKPGVGFPQARMGAGLRPPPGAVVDAAVGPSRGRPSGENARLRPIAGGVAPGSVPRADRSFAGWCDPAWRADRGVGVVPRVHQDRATDSRRGRRPGREGHVVRWPRRRRPGRMDRAAHLRRPAEREVREARARVGQRGSRTGVLVVVTTLADPAVSAAEIADLYRRRWQAELDLRGVRIPRGMDVLRCPSPGRVRKEIWAHRLAYNLVPAGLAPAAVVGRRDPRSLGMAAVVRGLAAVAAAVATGSGHGLRVRFGLAYRVGHRPDRVGPRMRKRRPKPYPPRPVPRPEARTRLLGGHRELGKCHSARVRSRAPARRWSAVG